MTVVTVTVGRWSVGILPVFESVFMEDVMVISTPTASFSCVPMAQHKHKSQHQTLRSLWGAQTRRNKASWIIVATTKHTASVVLVFHCNALMFFADLSIYGLGSKVDLSCTMQVGAVVMREALSHHLCFFHLLAGFAVRLIPSNVTVHA